MLVCSSHYSFYCVLLASPVESIIQEAMIRAILDAAAPGEEAIGEIGNDEHPEGEEEEEFADDSEIPASG